MAGIILPIGHVSDISCKKPLCICNASALRTTPPITMQKINVSEELQGPLPEGGRQGFFGGEVFVKLRGLLIANDL